MTPRRLSRRTVLRGLGATVALPLLDVMPAVATGLAGSGSGGTGTYHSTGLPLFSERHSARYLVSGGDDG